MFRSDLFYRLNVIPLEISPLRERKDDIPLLAAHFMDMYCRRFGKSVGKIPHYIISTLKRYDWPGNVREFANCIEYIANVMPGEGHILAEHLPPQLQDLGTGREPKSTLTLSVMEKEAITETLLRYPATQAGKRLAAKELGIGIATLYRKIKAYSIDASSR